MSEGEPISYEALQVGTPMLTAQGNQFGTVGHVLQIPELDLFDGIVVETEQGVRFVDRDQIDSITTTAVHCSIREDEVSTLPEPEGDPIYRVDAMQDSGTSLTARLGRMFRRGHWTREK
jgi:hypothetical protein